MMMVSDGDDENDTIMIREETYYKMSGQDNFEFIKRNTFDLENMNVIYQA